MATSIGSGVRAVVFDFDGVLADSEAQHLRSYREVLAPSGVSITDEAYCERYLGLDDAGVFGAVAADFGLMFGDEEIELLIDEKARRFEAVAAGGALLYPQAAACVRRLAERWPLGIASGARRSEIELVLRGADLLGAFAFIVAAGETDRSKPAPDPYLRAAELHQAQPSQCVAIEDSPAGLQAARAAGMRTIAVTHTYPAHVLAGRADVFVDSLDEIVVALFAGA